MDHMNMASSTMTSGMSMATGSSSSSMDSMMDSMMSMMVTRDGYTFMNMQRMAMTFFTATYTPLYSLSWIPTTTGQYAGTCIFLIVLAFIFRFLIALRSNLKFIVAAYTRKHDTEILRAAESSEDEEAKDLRREPSTAPTARPWRVNDALVWASVDTAIAGVSYLLMIAVMTMNVGYFMSVLGGTFLGSFVVGRWASAAGH